ncbi:hypothetical protein JK185_14755 [Gluconobacter wancherniae]|uniref:hypothetical protein n=1 Tax=Gluconobacter wancherniae TaxID=1307955 RepID=UPI001B8BF9CE|nr:hypothetical protein [Gluconobacter wancherniae]MBS1064248.1 hypothetical protein [Gluconobacter wancherniae]
MTFFWIMAPLSRFYFQFFYGISGMDADPALTLPDDPTFFRFIVPFSYIFPDITMMVIWAISANIIFDRSEQKLRTI